MYAPVDTFAVYTSARVKNVTVDINALGMTVIAAGMVGDCLFLLLEEEVERRGVWSLMEEAADIVVGVLGKSDFSQR